MVKVFLNGMPGFMYLFFTILFLICHVSWPRLRTMYHHTLQNVPQIFVNQHHEIHVCMGLKSSIFKVL